MIDISKTVLLSAEDICTRLSVSRSTFDRWRKITLGAPSPFGGGGGFQTQVLRDIRSMGDIDNDADVTPFPEPTLNVGGNPRWDAESINTWLEENKNKRNKRGFRT